MNAYNVYRQTQAHTAAPGELVVMLYRGALRFLASGIDAIERGDVPGAHNSLMRAQAIIGELHDSLDVQRGGDLARNLAEIYRYLGSRLVEANLRKDAAPAREVAQHIRELLPAWEEAARQSVAGSTRVLATAGR